MRTRIKFCGMTRSEDIATAASLGVDAVGLILAPRSARCLPLEEARVLRAAVPPLMSCVMLVMDQVPAEVERQVRILRPDLIQFHGDEDPADCVRPGLPFLKAVAMGDGGDASVAFARYAAAVGFVLDSHATGAAGGSGRRFDWDRVPRSPLRPILLAGGLDPDSVFDAVCRVRPWAVDVSSGIERAPGIKDSERMRRFVEAVRRADATAD